MANAPWNQEMQHQEQMRKEKAKNILFKEFRFYFDKDAFISYFCPPLAVGDFLATTNKAFNKQSLLEIPEESLTNQPKRFIQTSLVKFFALIDVFQEEQYKKVEEPVKNDGEVLQKEEVKEADSGDVPT